MAQTLFGSNATPSLPLLDANFTELYYLLGSFSVNGGALVNTPRLAVGGTDWTGGFAQFHSYSNINLGRAFSAHNAHNSAGSAHLVRVDFTACDLVAFRFGAATTVGNITTNGTTTAYNTSSDARLKTDVSDAADAGALIDAMRVVSFKWKSNGEFSRFGFIAQELNQVAPEAVTAGDAAAEIEVTWGVDPSKLVPLLVKELQSLRARVAALEAA